MDSMFMLLAMLVTQAIVSLIVAIITITKRKKKGENLGEAPPSRPVHETPPRPPVYEAPPSHPVYNAPPSLQREARTERKEDAVGLNEEYPMALPPKSILAGQYIIERVLGQGGFGITYAAIDHRTGRRVAIKEFFPDTLASRTTRTTVTAFPGERSEGFVYGKECFLQEAETLAQFIGNENVARVFSYFEENGTAYFVMEFIEGKSLDQYIKECGGKLPYEEAERILLPVIDALAAVHAKGIIHRDVTPDNIYITRDGVVKLLDFGAARYSLGDKSRSLDVVLKHGFAPKEQYTRHGKQGPYTDVYTVGASFYFAITGKRPPDSIDRMEEDELIPPSSLARIAPGKEEAILKAMSVQQDKRYQTMAEFREALLR